MAQTDDDGEAAERRAAEASPPPDPALTAKNAIVAIRAAESVDQLTKYLDGLQKRVIAGQLTQEQFAKVLAEMTTRTHELATENKCTPDQSRDFRAVIDKALSPEPENPF
jgi:hypothetical protein